MHLKSISVINDKMGKIHFDLAECMKLNDLTLSDVYLEEIKCICLYKQATGQIVQ